MCFRLISLHSFGRTRVITMYRLPPPLSLRRYSLNFLPTPIVPNQSPFCTLSYDSWNTYIRLNQEFRKRVSVYVKFKVSTSNLRFRYMSFLGLDPHLGLRQNFVMTFGKDDIVWRRIVNTSWMTHDAWDVTYGVYNGINLEFIEKTLSTIIRVKDHFTPIHWTGSTM